MKTLTFTAYAVWAIFSLVMAALALTVSSTVLWCLLAVLPGLVLLLWHDYKREEFPTSGLKYVRY